MGKDINKKIIIDGVDVSGCEHYEPNEYYTCGEKSTDNCEDVHNCIFKQLQRLKKENIKLKERTITRIDSEFLAIRTETYNEIIQELNDIKSQLEIEYLADTHTKKYSYRSNYYLRMLDRLEEQYNNLQEKVIELRQKNEELKEQKAKSTNQSIHNLALYVEATEALKDIKEIAKYITGTSTLTLAKEEARNILAKISEVIDE